MQNNLYYYQADALRAAGELAAQIRGFLIHQRATLYDDTPWDFREKSVPHFKDSVSAFTICDAQGNLVANFAWYDF